MQKIFLLLAALALAGCASHRGATDSPTGQEHGNVMQNYPGTRSQSGGWKGGNTSQDAPATAVPIDPSAGQLK